MSFSGYALSVRGASHEGVGEPCQDSARVYISEEFSAAAVSDGHGSEKHFRSASGSEMATRIAIRSLADFCERNGGLDGIFAENPENSARRIAANIIYSWNNEVATHLRFAPLKEAERAISEKHGGLAPEQIYGATLIVAAVTERMVFGLQIGDGSFVMNTGGGDVFPMPDDERLVGNLTTSLCDADAILSFRWFCVRERCRSVILSSDGLINSFRSREDFLSFGRRALRLASADNTSALAEHLRERSRSGSRDDISVAVLTADSP